MHNISRIAALAIACITSAANAAEWSDSFIGYSYGSKFREPGSADDVKKHIVTLQYVGGYKYGVNFFSVDLLKSDLANPAKGPGLGTSSNTGAQELYLTYNNTLSFGKLSGTPLKFGPLRDVGMQAGFDFNAKNDAFGSGVVKLIGGPKVEFDVPGLLTLGLFYYRELHSNNGIVGSDVKSKAAPRLATVWAFDLNAGAPAVFKGWATHTGSKGKDGFGGNTSPETWVEASLLWDIGAGSGKPKTFYAGLGYQYIKNKFGSQPSVPGSRVSAPSLRFEAHF
ncbi:MAG TPA: outer envelope protein [Burkholderiaceae bacterium]|nr:outer envelope protein [Burkholderiaceae bacterium]